MLRAKAFKDCKQVVLAAVFLWVIFFPLWLRSQATTPKRDNPRLQAILNNTLAIQNKQRQKKTPYKGYAVVREFLPLGMTTNITNVYFLYVLNEKHRGQMMEKKYFLYDKNNKTLSIYPILSRSQQRMKESELQQTYGIKKNNLRLIATTSDKLSVEGLPYQLFFYPLVVKKNNQQHHALNIFLKKNDNYYWVYCYIAMENLRSPLKVMRAYKGLTGSAVIVVVQKEFYDNLSSEMRLYEVPILIDGNDIMGQADLKVTPKNNWQLNENKKHNVYQIQWHYANFNASSFYRAVTYHIDGSSATSTNLAK